MSSRPRRPRQGQAGRTAKVVTNKIRSLHLTQEPGWYMIRSRNTDPPTYNQQTTYNRRVRIVLAVPAAGHYIVPADVYTAAQLATTVFSRFTISAISVYGETVTGVAVQTNTIVNNTTTVLGRTYSDYGVPNNRRACVKLSISPRDQQWLASTATANIVGIEVLSADQGVGAAGNVIVDLMCHFRATIPVLKLRPEAEVFRRETLIGDSWDDIQEEVISKIRDLTGKE